MICRTRRCRAALRARLVVLLAALCAPVLAQAPQVRSSLQAPDTLWVGQGVVVVVELLAPGYFDSAASFALPDPAGVLLMPPAGHPLVGSETIDGIDYTVQRHELRAWPMRAGEQSVPAITVRFGFKHNPMDTDAENAELSTAPLPLQVQSPPGAQDLGTVLSARDLQLEEHWEPQPDDAEVLAGSAFTRTVTFTAPDLPGMLFPPFPAARVDGLGIYSKQEVLDSEHRGELQGQRRDTITYVMQRPGDYRLPPVQLHWFDLDAGTLRSATLPGQVFRVVANPALAAGESQAQRTELPLRVYGLAALLLVLLAAAGWRLSRSPLWMGRLARCIAPLRPRHLRPLYPSSRRR
ncbi:hypothetical protein E4634_10555 [Mangrovimicrobium sediminis]|uniref:Protein BatD n=1 Tax=Mangrovimicrobium sediminis TaxID=2562682 RepID=A0A4Z0M1A0_9GAMM|nr:BatD family protein [Haliea sp. SAOS-164]TGD73463.1 hypothetical protein E4634_10555 [Haliea sp. SAOS-164]